MTIEERIRGRRIGVLGMARSGVAAAQLAARFGGVVFVSDSASGPRLNEPISELKKFGIPFETGGHTERLMESDYVVISPGIPPAVEIVQQIRERGIPIFSEIEFASWVCQAPIVAVTGSNGKTTTTTLIGEIFTAAGFETVVCGNIGRPFAQVADRVPADGVAVVEVSSYQLESIADFHPHVALLLNLQADHLDRHGSFGAYRATKLRVTENQEKDDCFITNADDPAILPEEITTRARRLTFSIEARTDSVTFVEDGKLRLHRESEIKNVIDIEQIRIKGRHNLQNASAAVAATAQFKIAPATMARVLREFPGVEHRLEPLGSVAGIYFVNDSKATNVDSMLVALESMTRPVFLICGGRDKGSPYVPVIEAGRGKIKGLVAIGEAREKIFNELGQAFPVEFADSLEDAVLKAFEQASPGDVVLLSPGCASFDMFENFEHRGKVYKQAVAGLRNGKKKDETVTNS